ncbi:MAG TPA: urease accessory protein UreF [Geminicoccaceae bacterium]|nr:urease accessory protein UreF [Geminicoccus sp.]HMU52088.1 urease accessory protein UreF [Geminicoccaceae bacterium]
MATEAELQKLLQWFSPAYPVGGFSFSHGLEWAVDCGLVRDRDGLIGWLADVLRQGAGWADAVLLVHAHGSADDPGALAGIAELAGALPATSELHLETVMQGDAFARVTEAVWPALPLGLDADPPLPIAVGVAAARHGLPLAAVLPAYLHALCANLVSAGVRLVPLGQSDGQRALAALAPVVREVATRAPGVALDDLGTASVTVDWCSMRHERQYTRLFRS